MNNPNPDSSPYDMPQRGGRSPLMLLLITLWLIVILTIVTSQFLIK